MGHVWRLADSCLYHRPGWDGDEDLGLLGQASGINNEGQVVRESAGRWSLRVEVVLLIPVPSSPVPMEGE